MGRREKTSGVESRGLGSTQASLGDEKDVGEGGDEDAVDRHPGGDEGGPPGVDLLIQSSAGDFPLGDGSEEDSAEDVAEDLDAVEVQAPTRRGRAKASPGEAEENGAAAGEIAAVYVAVGDLHPWKQNPRWKDKKKFKKAVRMLMRSIRRFGFGAPMLARLANKEIIAGHTRWAAAKRLGHKTVPVRFMDLLEDEAHALALGDNKTAEFGEWDPDKVEAVMRDLESRDVDLTDGTGFDEDEVDEMLITDDDDFDLDEDQGGGGSARGSGHLKYRILIECTGEEDQALLLTQLEASGRVCKPLMS